jgi:hypothetical protein
MPALPVTVEIDRVGDLGGARRSCFDLSFFFLLAAGEKRLQ